MAKQTALPPTLAPRGVTRAVAAAYVSVSEWKFDQMIADSLMPKPKRVGGRSIWDLREIDAAFERLPCDGEKVSGNEWDAVLGDGDGSDTTLIRS